MSRHPESGLPATDLDSLLATRTPDPVALEHHPDADGVDDGAAPDENERSSRTVDGSDGGPDVEDGALRQVAVASIVPNELQPRRRFDEDEMAALTDSVRALGVLQPVLVRPIGDNRYELIAGERRWRAARRAGLAEIPAVVRSADDRRSLEEAIVENLHRADLNAIEEAAAFQQLVEDFGLTQDEVAARVGKSRSAVSNTLRLFQLPAMVQRQVVSGDLSAGHARALLGLDDPRVQRDMADRIVSESLSVRQVEDLVKAALDGRGRAGASRGGQSRGGSASGDKSAAALEIEQALADRLSTEVTVEEASGTGRVVIRFADGDDLSRIYELLSEGSDREDR